MKPQINDLSDGISVDTFNKSVTSFTIKNTEITDDIFYTRRKNYKLTYA